MHMRVYWSDPRLSIQSFHVFLFFLQHCAHYFGLDLRSFGRLSSALFLPCFFAIGSFCSTNGDRHLSYGG